MKWNCSSFSFDTRMPILMGILNVTPDSFSDGGQFEDFDKAIAHAMKMVEEGAEIIDVGGESTRPGSSTPSIEEELARTVKVVQELSLQGICVSVDTRHVEVARACVDAGASIINDVSGFRDPAMVEFAASADVGLVVMHMKSEPGNMQEDTAYSDVVHEVYDYLKQQVEVLEEAGVSHNRICIDPGPGFGKDADQTLELLRNIHEFARMGYPVMVAVSRKSFIGKNYDIEQPHDRDEASAVESLMAIELGASVIRTHNIGLAVRMLQGLRPYALLGLGSNVALVAEPGEEREAKIAQLNQAIGSLCILPDSQLIDISAFYESKPAYKEDQDDFVNAVVLIRTGLPPKELLRYIHSIEDSLGRVREVPNGPRTCDIDILDFQLYVCDTEDLTLPHPHLLERDFVVKPLLEIRPGHVLANDVEVTDGAVSVGKAERI